MRDKRFKCAVTVAVVLVISAVPAEPTAARGRLNHVCPTYPGLQSWAILSQAQPSLRDLVLKTHALGGCVWSERGSAL
jgi:hypothetical protein